MKYPRTSSYAWIGFIKRTPFWRLLAILLGGYVLINLSFGVIYYDISALSEEATFLDHVYTAFVTSLSIGYSQFPPIPDPGKIVVMTQGCMTATYFALLVAMPVAADVAPAACCRSRQPCRIVPEAR